MSLRILDIDSVCTGCGACASICPKNALSIVSMPKMIGFYYPSVDENSCVQCGSCEKVCPKLNPVDTDTKEEPKAAFMLQALDNEVLEKSSSGGVFSVFAQEVINRGGVVWGSAYNYDLERLETISTESTSLEKLRKSKYIETYSGTIFREVKQQLKADRWCLFVGTPCQVTGLNHFLKQTKTPQDKLLTVRFVCHGVPSNEYFRNTKSQIEKTNRGNVAEFVFRSKINGWRESGNLQVLLDNGKSNYYTGANLIYFSSFFKHELLRRSCYSCKEICKVESDFTMGDFWGVFRYKPEYKDNRGLSLLLVHSQKALDFFESIHSSFHYESLPARSYAYIYEEATTKERMFSDRIKMEKYVKALGYPCYTWLRYYPILIKGKIKMSIYRIYKSILSK